MKRMNRITIKIVIPEEKTEKFIRNMSEFTEYLEITPSRRLSKAIMPKRTRTKRNKQKKQIENTIRSKGEMTTKEIYDKVFRRTGYSYKTLTRLLIELCIEKKIKVKKIQTEKGGFKNKFRIEE